MIDLGTFPGDSCSNAYFVNMRGQVVGTSENRDLCHMGVGEHAFLWQHGHMIDLNTVIPPGASLNSLMQSPSMNGARSPASVFPPAVIRKITKSAGMPMSCFPATTATNALT